MWPNFGERRVWSLIFSYALPAISPGPVLTILALYLGQGLNMTQAQVNNVVWVPPLTWGIGYFFWGWAADKFATTNRRPIGMFLLLCAASLTLGFATWTTSPAVAIALISFSTFIGGGFQMVALKAGSFAFPREQSAMMTGIASGSWSLVNFILLNAIGAGFAIWGCRSFPVQLAEPAALGGDLLADCRVALDRDRRVGHPEPERAATRGGLRAKS